MTMLSLSFLILTIYFFQVKDLPSHDWNYIKNNFWLFLSVSMLAGFSVAIEFYNHRKH